jgi:hypothetical protein
MNRYPSSRIAPRAQLVQQVILREITVPTNVAVPLAADLGPAANIGTFMVQNVGNPFNVYVTTQPVPDPSVFLPPFIEIPAGSSPVFQIASQPDQVSTVVWDLTMFWVIGDNTHVGQTAVITLAAFPLAI